MICIDVLKCLHCLIIEKKIERIKKAGRLMDSFTVFFLFFRCMDFPRTILFVLFHCLPPNTSRQASNATKNKPADIFNSIL